MPLASIDHVRHRKLPSSAVASGACYLIDIGNVSLPQNLELATAAIRAIRKNVDASAQLLVVQKSPHPYKGPDIPGLVVIDVCTGQEIAKKFSLNNHLLETGKDETFGSVALLAIAAGLPFNALNLTSGPAEARDHGKVTAYLKLHHRPMEDPVFLTTPSPSYSRHLQLPTQSDAFSGEPVTKLATPFMLPTGDANLSRVRGKISR